MYTIPARTVMEAQYLENNLPLRVFAALTLPFGASKPKLDTCFREWIRAVRSHNRQNIAWIRAYEPLPMRHAHAVLLAPGPLDCDHASRFWRKLTAARNPDAAYVEPYQYGIGGLSYVMKTLDSDAEDIAFSENLAAFVLGCEPRFFGYTRAQRRHIRRVQRQMSRS